MQAPLIAHQELPSPADQVDALRIALRIMDKWGCTMEEKATLLGGVSISSLYRLAESTARQKGLGRDLVERVSHILNIHAALRIIFSLPESIYGWVRRPNDSAPYHGRSPMEMMQEGSIVDLYKVHSQLDVIRGGGWG